MEKVKLYKIRNNMHYINAFAITISLSFGSNNLLCMTELPVEIQEKILFHVIDPDAVYLSSIACVSKNWNALVTNVSFVEYCEAMNICMKPAVVFYAISRNETLLTFLNEGILSYNEREKQGERLISFYEIPELNDKVHLEYIDPKRIRINPMEKGIFLKDFNRFIGILVNPNTTIVHNDQIGRNPLLDQTDRIHQYELSAMTLKKYITQRQRANAICPTLKSYKSVRLSKLTAEPEIYDLRDKLDPFDDEYENIISLKSPVPAARIIQDATLLTFHTFNTYN